MPEYNDGSVPYGFGGTAALYTTPDGGSLIGNYVVESLTYDAGGSQIDRRNGSNVMSGRVAIDDMPGTSSSLGGTGTATLQRATSSTVAPKIGNGVQLDGLLVPAPLVNKILVITGVTHNYSQAEAHTFSVNFAVTSGEI